MALTWRHALAWLAPPEGKPWGLLAAAYVALYVLGLIWRGPADGNWTIASRAALILPGLLSAAAALGARRAALSDPARPAASRRLPRVWGFLGLALLLWTLAYALSLAYLLADPGLSPPSLSDLARAGGYGLAGAALLTFPLAPREQLGRLRLVLDMLVTSGAVLGLSWLILIRPISQVAAGVEQWFWAAFYPAADLLLLLILANVFLAASANASPAAIGWIATGMVLFLLADLAATYQSLRGGRVAMGFVGLGWLLGLTLLGLAAARQRRSLPARPDADRLRRLSIILKALLPIVITFVLVWVVLLDVQRRGQPDLVAAGLTVVLALLLVARQGVMGSEIELREYAQLVNSGADPAFICGADGRLRLVNPALLAATGYEAEEVLRRPAAMLFTDGALPLAAGQRPDTVYKTGWSGEVNLRRRDGSEFPAYLALRPAPSDLPAPAGLVGTAHDLAEQKRHQARLLAAYEEVAAARRALERLNQQLEAKVTEKTSSLSEAYARLAAQHEALQTLDTLKSDFVSLVSHELRAPLTNISGGIELLLSAPEALSVKTRRSLTLVQSEIHRLTHFVETILDLSALEAGRLPLYPEPLAVPPLVEAVVQQFEGRPGSERLCWSVPAGLPAGLADEHAVTSVLFQLIDNALKYAPAGAIGVTAAAGSGRLEISVVDQGPGIPPERLEAIFDRFERLDAADDREVYGHGLGLYMTRRLLAAQDGGIVASNSPEGGACFTFWIPTTEVEDADQDPVG